MATSDYREIRIGDAEREQAVSALGEHYLAGRLTKEEYDERTAVALTARTASALQPLFADLPSQQAVVAQPVEQRRRRRRLPVLPVAMALLVLLLAFNVPWWGWMILAWMWCSGMFAGMTRRFRHSRC